MKKLNKRWLVLPASLLLLLAFQNCSKVQVASSPINSSSGDPNPPGGGIDDPNPPGRYVATFKFKPSERKTDIILVIDNSGSMKPESLQLASRLSGFVTYLASLSVDWQMCLTTTDIGKSDDRAIKWTGTNSYIVNASTANLSSVFTNSINDRFAGNGGSGDERGVASLNKHIDSQNKHKCYRPGALTTTIILSDENERSDGRNLEEIDKPSNYLTKLSDLQVGLGYHSNVLSNSIIVKSGDTSCYNEQNKDFPAYYGTVYEHLSALTQGNVGSICSPDYSAQLTDISHRIDAATGSVLLQCAPVSNSVRVLSSNAPAGSYTWDVRDNRIYVTSASTTEFDVKFDYLCQ